MNFFVILMTTFAAFASAIPHAGRSHAHGHQLAHGIKHHVQVAHAAAVAGRSVSYDGSCGYWSGMTCAEGFCCGPEGWCGNASEHCGVGCQAGFGDCGSGSSPSSYVEPEPSVVETQSISAAEPTTSTAVILSPITSSSSSTSAASTSSASMAISLANKGSDDEDGHRPDRPSYGAPHTTLVTKTMPAAPSSQTEQPSASENSPSAYLVPSAVPTTAESSPPVSSVSASPTDSSSAPSSYGSATPSPTSGGGGGDQSQGGAYIRTYKGDGSTNAGWPSQNEWLSFDNMWEANQEILKSSCSSAFSQIDNSDQELDDIKSSIEDVSSSTGVEKTFVLAIMLQESNGCVRVQTTSYSHANPGLFQSHEGSGSCNDGSKVQTPCPKTQIHQMIEDGVAGTSAGDGLKQLLDAAKGDGAQKFYQAARMYNSGSLDPSGNLGLGVATHCYSSDIANRLTGWSAGVSKCDAGTVGA